VSERDNEAIVRRYFEEVWNKGNFQAADELIDLRFSVEGCGGAISGQEAVKLYISSYRQVYPNVRFTTLSMVAEGDRVVACWVCRGMYTACDCQDESPRASKCSTTGLSVYRISNGKIADAWGGSDHTGMGTVRRLGIQGNKDQ
jgi:predicted ester cyclase